MHRHFTNENLRTLIVLREHDSVWAPQAQRTVLASAEALHSGLARAGYTVVPLAIKSADELILDLRSFDPQSCLVFNWYEGVEEGAYDALQVAERLETLGYTYTGADPLALALTQDKARTKQVLHAHGIPTPRWQIVSSEPTAWDHFPAIIKVANEHGSEGLTCESVVHDRTDLRRRVQALESAGARPLLIAEFIEGREFTVGMWGNSVIEFLPLLEVDYSACPPGQPRLRTSAAKWETDSREIHGSRLVPPVLPAGARRWIERLALDTFCVFGLRDYARIDLRLKGEEPQVIDVNANPDITPGSSFVQAAEQGGYAHSEILDRIVRTAWVRAKHPPTGVATPEQEPVGG